MDSVFYVLREKQEVVEIPKTQPEKRLQVIIKQLFIYLN
jgi:hypothetical protein